MYFESKNYINVALITSAFIVMQSAFVVLVDQFLHLYEVCCKSFLLSASYETSRTVTEVAVVFQSALYQVKKIRQPKKSPKFFRPKIFENISFVEFQDELHQ